MFGLPTLELVKLSRYILPTHPNSPNSLFFQCFQWLCPSSIVGNYRCHTLGTNSHFGNQLQWKLQWPTPMTTSHDQLWWPILSSDYHLWQQTLMTNSDNHLHATNSRFWLQTQVKIIFDDHLRETTFKLR